jgi:hypothetical protein
LFANLPSYGPNFSAFFLPVVYLVAEKLITPDRTHKENSQCYNDFIFVEEEVCLN